MNSTDESASPPWNAGFDSLSTPQLVFTFIWAVESVFGLVSNAFVLYVVPFRLPARSTLDIFILFLALSDFIANAIVSTITWTNGISGGWHVSAFCSLNASILTSCGVFNLLMLCTIARYRYFTVVHQQKATRFSLIINVVLLLLMPLVWGTEQQMDFASVSIHQSGTLCMYRWWAKGRYLVSSVIGVVFFGSCYTLISYYYWHIAKVFKRTSENVRQLLGRKALRSDEHAVSPLPATLAIGSTQPDLSNLRNNQVMPLTPPVVVISSNEVLPSPPMSQPTKLTVASSSASGTEIPMPEVSPVSREVKSFEKENDVKLIISVDGITDSPRKSQDVESPQRKNADIGEKENKIETENEKDQDKAQENEERKVVPKLFLAPIDQLSSPSSPRGFRPSVSGRPSNLNSGRVSHCPAPSRLGNVSPMATVPGDAPILSAFERRLEFERRLTLKTFSLVAAFFGCWLVYSVLLFYELISSNEADVYFDGIANILAEGGLFVNPILYCVFDARYRNELKKIVEKATCRWVRLRQEETNAGIQVDSAPVSVSEKQTNK